MGQAANLYTARLGKVRWFIKRFGAAELFWKPVRVLGAPVWLRFLGRQQFSFQGESLEYFYHAYNMTWATERCLEVPIARFYTRRCPESGILEVGNVLSHYGPIRHQVVDKYENGPGIINSDVLDFAPGRQYQLIISISTFEHIGFDDAAIGDSRTKIQAAIHACRKLLEPTGLMMVTIPIGYNPDMDALIAQDQLSAQREFYFLRTGPRAWIESTKPAALKCRYRTPYPYANAVLIAEIPPATGTGRPAAKP